MHDKETLYARWLSGEITEEELRELKETGALEELERIAKATEKLSLPKYDTTKGYENLKAKRTAKTPKVRQLNWKWGAGIAASFLLLIFAYNHFKTGGQEVIMANSGANEQLLLQDGSNVLINDGSSIAYDKENWRTNRTLDLKGEAFFKVEKGSAFVVNTKNGSVEVLGTEFNVRAWGDNLYVECYEGSVHVSIANNETTLVMNESVNVVGGEMSKKQKINHQSPQWSAGISRFYVENINEVFSEIERQFGVSVKAPSLNQKFSGAFLHGDLDKALLSICKPTGLEFKISADRKEIVIE